MATYGFKDYYTKSEIDAGIYSADSYSLRQPGQIGFGVAPARKDKYEAIGAVPFEGHDSITSPNRGKYLHVVSGSVLYHIPKHYYKYVVNGIAFSDTPQEGFVLDRSFVNGGVELDGVFIFAYGGGNNSGKLTAQAGLDPMSTSSAHNPISALSTAPANNYGGCYKAAKSCDAQAFVTPIWQRTMVARLARAHGKASLSSAVCAFVDVAPFKVVFNIPLNKLFFIQVVLYSFVLWSVCLIVFIIASFVYVSKDCKGFLSCISVCVVCFAFCIYTLFAIIV